MSYKTHGSISFGLREDETGQVQPLDQVLNSLVTDELAKPAGGAAVGGASSIKTGGTSSRTVDEKLSDGIAAWDWGGTETVQASIKGNVGGKHGQHCLVGGYYAAGDGGGGLFVWDANCALADDGGITINPTGNAGNGRWRRIITDAVNLRWFGAKGDGSTDDTAAIASAISFIRSQVVLNTYAPGQDNSSNRRARTRLYIPAGAYLVTSAFGIDLTGFTTITRGLHLFGDGGAMSQIIFMPANEQTETGTAQAGDALTVTLASGASAVDGFYIGCRIQVGSSDVNGQSGICTGYVGSTKVATLDTTIVTPATSSTAYTIRGVPWTGTAQAGSTTTITLPASFSSVTDFYKGMRLTTTGGTGSGQQLIISAYDGSTKVATLARAATTGLDGTTTFSIQGSVLIRNTDVTGLRVSGIEFVTEGANHLSYWSDRTNGKSLSDIVFNDVQWSGFAKGLQLDNTFNNNNDNHSFVKCKTRGITDCFLHLKDSDQELIFEFFGFHHTSARGPIVRSDAGGGITCYGIDASNWGRNAPTPCYLFELNTIVAGGASNFLCDGLRVELVSTTGNARVLYSGWKNGNIRIENMDLESQAPFYGFHYPVIRLNIGSTVGPHLSVENSKMVGQIEIEYNTTAYGPEGSFTFRNCGWYDRTTWEPKTPDEVVVYTRTGAHNNKGVAPAVRFENCKKHGTRSNSTLEIYVWDYTVGHRTQRYAVVGRKLLASNAFAQGLPTANAANLRYIYFPIGAIITGFRIFAPAGSSTENSDVTYKLQTHEATPTVLATITGTNPSTTVIDQFVELANRWDCNSDLARQLTILADTNVAQANVNASVWIEYIG